MLTAFAVPEVPEVLTVPEVLVLAVPDVLVLAVPEALVPKLPGRGAALPALAPRAPSALHHQHP